MKACWIGAASVNAAWAGVMASQGEWPLAAAPLFALVFCGREALRPPLRERGAGRGTPPI